MEFTISKLAQAQLFILTDFKAKMAGADRQTRADAAADIVLRLQSLLKEDFEDSHDGSCTSEDLAAS